MKRIIFILIASMSLVFNSCKTNDFVRFYPEIWKNESYILDVDGSYKFYDNLRKVLEYYNEDFIEKDNVIYIRKDLFEDKELCYNYTKKANDLNWLDNR